jgi:uncharacterized membrane protein
MYKIIGADQKEYGPVSAEQMRQWINEGRVNAQTKVLADGITEWKTLAEVPEFADVLAAKIPPVGAVSEHKTNADLPTDLFARDYDLDIGGCIGSGWSLLKDNFSLLLCGTLIYFGIELGIGLLGAIPFIGPLFSLANLFVVGPLLGGLYFLILQAIRRQPAGAGDIFMGFRTAYLQLFLGGLIPGLLACLCMIPVGVAAVFTITPSILRHQPPGLGSLSVLIAVALACMIPMVVLQVNWIFTLPLIIDKRMNFWPAMQASWKMVTKHWWQVFALLLLVGLLNVVGVLLCCVGLLFTVPIGFGALIYAYEAIFGSRRAQIA